MLTGSSLPSSAASISQYQHVSASISQYHHASISTSQPYIHGCVLHMLPSGRSCDFIVKGFDRVKDKKLCSLPVSCLSRRCSLCSSALVLGSAVSSTSSTRSWMGSPGGPVT